MFHFQNYLRISALSSFHYTSESFDWKVLDYLHHGVLNVSNQLEMRFTICQTQGNMKIVENFVEILRNFQCILETFERNYGKVENSAYLKESLDGVPY